MSTDWSQLKNMKLLLNCLGFDYQSTAYTIKQNRFDCQNLSELKTKICSKREVSFTWNWMPYNLSSCWTIVWNTYSLSGSALLKHYYHLQRRMDYVVKVWIPSILSVVLGKGCVWLEWHVAKGLQCFWLQYKWQSGEPVRVSRRIMPFFQISSFSEERPI